MPKMLLQRVAILLEDMTQLLPEKKFLYTQVCRWWPLLFVHHLTANPPETRPEVQSSGLGVASSAHNSSRAKKSDDLVAGPRPLPAAILAPKINMGVVSISIKYVGVASCLEPSGRVLLPADNYHIGTSYTRHGQPWTLF